MSASFSRTATLFGGILLSSLVSLPLVADQRSGASGYAADSDANILRSRYGDCVRTGSWGKDDATVVGCDDVTLDAQVEIYEGAPSGLIGSIDIPAAALFAFDSDELTEDGKAAIESYRKELKPELSEAYAGIIIGHTDSTGDADYNMGLSKRRAASVSDYLVSTGVDAGKLRVVGRGENEPLVSNDTKEGQAQNRRVEIIVIGEPRALDMIRFPSVALFPRRSAELTDEGKRLIEENRGKAREILKRASYVEIVGHTDDVGDDAYNQELSEQRAETVRRYLVDADVDPSKIVTLGAGESLPIASNNTPEGRAENRRVEVLVLGRTNP